MSDNTDITQPGWARTSGHGKTDEILAEIERRRAELNVGLLRIYNYYRILIGLALMATAAQTLVQTRLGSLNPDLFWVCAISYTLINIFIAVATSAIPPHRFRHQLASVAIACYDVLTLSAIMYASNGVSSGIAALLLITVAASAILLTGRSATLIAAAASIAVLYEESYLGFADIGATPDYFQAGVFGILYFAASLSIQNLTKRIRANDIRALTQAVELADLERLNRIILQRMRTGIIVVDKQDTVRMSNQSARALIGAAASTEMYQLPVALQNELSSWRDDMSRRGPPFQVSLNAPEIRANFSPVRSDNARSDVTIFLEDTAEVQQQAQQLKLAELGRLSASIAHEVRNPLGAISHAAQLLNESEDLEPPDRRLTDIIINHCHRMNGVVENVLEMSRRKTPMPTRVNLHQHVELFRNVFIESLPEAKIDILFDPTQTDIRVDPKQLDQVLTNLVDNGIRYSEHNGNGQHVQLEGGVERNSERPYVNVIDFGTGVEPAQIAKLFHPFSTSSQDGTGLGLYLARELCEANQAQLSYFPHNAGGSCFRILFAHPDRIPA